MPAFFVVIASDSGHAPDKLQELVHDALSEAFPDHVFMVGWADDGSPTMVARIDSIAAPKTGDDGVPEASVVVANGDSEAARIAQWLRDNIPATRTAKPH